MEKSKPGAFMRFINGVERVGNKLPHPFIMFVWLIGFVITLSIMCEWLGVAVTYTKLAAGKAPETITIQAKSLLSKESIQYFFLNFQKHLL